MDKHVGLNIIILDACRENPFRSWMSEGESDNRGFNVVKSQSQGTVIAFATMAGKWAKDGDGSNG